MKCLESEDEYIVKSAIHGLSIFLNKSTTKILVEISMNEKYYGHDSALCNLHDKGFFYDSNNFEMFVKMLYNGNSGSYVITGLSYVNDKKAIEPLIYALNKHHISNRELGSVEILK